MDRILDLQGMDSSAMDAMAAAEAASTSSNDGCVCSTSSFQGCTCPTEPPPPPDPWQTWDIWICYPNAT